MNLNLPMRRMQAATLRCVYTRDFSCDLVVMTQIHNVLRLSRHQNRPCKQSEFVATTCVIGRGED